MRPSAEINITPFIDVLLVLLIIFMVVTPLATTRIDVGVPAPAPTAAPAPPPRPVNAALVLHVEREALSLNGRPMSGLEELKAELRARLEVQPDRVLWVGADGDVAYARVVDALDAAKGAGVGRVGILPGTERLPVR